MVLSLLSLSHYTILFICKSVDTVDSEQTHNKFNTDRLALIKHNFNCLIAINQLVEYKFDKDQDLCLFCSLIYA